MKIFISHAHSDWRLAQRIQDLLEEVSGRGFEVDRSSEKGAIKSGENWRGWIDDKIVGCDVAIVLLTPASFRGKWVLWEAGAVTGVQYERKRGADLDANDPSRRRVRALRFGIDTSDLGPFGSAQISDGLKQADVVAFVSEMLDDYREQLSNKAYREGMLGLNETATKFIAGAKEDLRYTPIHAGEDVVQEWLARLDEHKDGNDRWIIASKRWINVAFLGAGNADAHLREEPQAVDFRIHMRIADAHKHLKEWNGVVEQLKLAKSLSPNDLVVLRELGRAYREIKDAPQLEKVMAQMEQLDPKIFVEDREGVGLRCGYYAELKQWEKVDELLANANASLVAEDFYLAGWQAIARMKAKGPEPSKLLFKQLKELLIKAKTDDFWDRATLANALLALDEQDQARAVLESLDLSNRTKDEVESASRFYDEIISSFEHKFDWRAAAGI